MDFTPVNEYGPRLCQRCNVQFDVSVTFEYIRGKDGSGRACCPPCAKHYIDRKAAELAQNNAVRGMGNNQHSGIDFTSMGASRESLVKATSAAQRGKRLFPSQRFSSESPQMLGKLNPGQMLPPPAPVSSYNSLGHSNGYTANHQFHHQHRSKMLRAASSSRGQIVTIRAALHHLKPEGKSGTLLVGNIERDMRVSLSTTRTELRLDIIWHLQSPWTEWSRKHSLTLESLEMHKSPMMLLFDPRQPLYDPDAVVLHDFFLRSTTKDLVPKFYASTKVAILLIMTHAQYESVQLWREQIDELRRDDATEMKDVQTNLHTSPPVYATDEASNTMHSELPSRHLKKPRSPSHTTSSPTSRRAHKRVKENDHSTIYQTQGIETNDSEQDPEQSTTSQSLLSMSMSAVETHLPSRISSLLPATPQLFLPSQQQLEAAMKAQGSIRKQASAVCKYNSNTFRVYQIRSVKFQDIITTPLDVTSSPFDLVSISIDSDAKSMIGTAGSFKTCHPALLHTTSLSATPGPSTSQSSIFTATHVVAKRVFFRKRDGNSKRQRFSKEDELGRTLDEANCLYWATCLMSLVYIFVDEMLQTQTVKQTVANEVPRLRLVYAAVAIPEDILDRAGAAYLLEERIEGKFIKYINNNSAAPAHHLRGKEEKIGLFLCFAQHVQYQLTNEVVYLSDFQGSGDLLTDCQVMTGPDYMTNFGEGNCTEAFRTFKTTHKCNVFCRAFGLQPFIIAKQD